MEDSNKPHRPSRRKEKNSRKSERGQNPKVRACGDLLLGTDLIIFSFDRTANLDVKAFAPSSGRSLEKRARRKADQDERRLHVPLPDRTGDDQAPIVVVIAGPPKVWRRMILIYLSSFTILTIDKVWKVHSYKVTGQKVHQACHRRDKRADYSDRRQ